ncbi:MAG: CinA family nicotinamide mononucleotide deamidase-related protein, partial [Deltaproteobacteria bacterium]|nr:CinA family nicotinamide mononucleotide deamidase-related protein [Deltaproteobacteria bacterium]
MRGERRIVEFLVTGDEVVRGVIADTNTAATAAKLYPLGLHLAGTSVVGDRGEDIRRGMLEIAARADVCIVSGGLGPTADDLTAECAAQASGVPLVLDNDWLVHLRTRWAQRRPGEAMPVNSERQAFLPKGAEKLGNPDGSAPAFAFRIGECQFFCLPGVPREYHRIIDETVLPRMVQLAGGGVLRSRVLQCFGISESALDEKVKDAAQKHPMVRFGFRTKFPENHLSLASRAPTAEQAEWNLAAAERDCRAALGDFVYGQDGVTFAQGVGLELVRRKETIGCAESCTGGLLGSMLTETAGSSAWFLGGVIAYANAVKMAALGVPWELLGTHGAVSEPCARRMAEGARKLLGSTWAVSITGVAGPEGGTEEK